MARSRKRILLSLLLIVPWPVAWSVYGWNGKSAQATREPTALKMESKDGMVRLPGGTFAMGSPYPDDEDARPVHRVRVSPFWLDATPVTNAEFSEFVEETGFVTTAERNGEGLVFDFEVGNWRNVAGATWKTPLGPDSSIIVRGDYPVVQITWYDAAAYAKWAGKRLPTEAEMEYASRGGLNDCEYPWGRELQPEETFYRANYWQGLFPTADLGLDGFRNVGPTKSFAPNRFGLFDMAGNVWQWCSDWYSHQYYGHSAREDPKGHYEGEFRVRRGGSWLSTAHLRNSLRVFHRNYAPPSESTNHTGFRCAMDIEKKLLR